MISKYKDPVMNQSGFHEDNVMSGFLVPISPIVHLRHLLQTHQFLSFLQLLGRTPVHYCALNGDAGTLRAFVDLANICSAELSLGAVEDLMTWETTLGRVKTTAAESRWKLKMFFFWGFCSDSDIYSDLAIWLIVVISKAVFF